MLAPDQNASDSTLPAIQVRALLRRAALPALLVLGTAGGLILAGGHVSAVTDGLRRAAHVSGLWTGAGVVFEVVSLAGYVMLLSLVAGAATPRIGRRESAQITLVGAAATRLLPTAGAGGAATTLFSLRRAGLRAGEAARTLLVFLVSLYAVFLSAIVLAGGALVLGLARSHATVALSAVPAGAALAGIVAALGFGLAVRRGPVGVRAHSRRARTARLLGGAVLDVCRLVRSPDIRLIGAVAYWAFDAAVLWAMLNAFGRAPALPIVVLAYFVGQAANTLPLPGSVSGGIAGVLIAFGLPAGLALAAVLAYRTIAVWLPVPVALAAIPRLRATFARWSAEDATHDEAAPSAANVSSAAREQPRPAPCRRAGRGSADGAGAHKESTPRIRPVRPAPASPTSRRARGSELRR